MATTLREYLDKNGVLSVWAQMKAWVKNYAKIVVNNGTPTIIIGTDSIIPLTEHQDISGKADKSEMAVTPGTGANADKTTIQLKNGLSATVLTAHQDISGKADKVSGATAGNVATLDANGNIVDSGKSADSIGTDTKNTAGSTNDTAKLFLVGAKSQAANPQTFSQANVYATGGKIFSNGKETVNLSDEQALTNKTYNGFTLAAACAKGVDTSITEGSTSTNLPTSKAVADAIAAAKVGAATFQGTVDVPADISGLTNYKRGYYWIVATAGEYAGETCEVGDMIFCVADYGTAFKASDFSVVQSNLNVSRIDETWITENCV